MNFGNWFLNYLLTLDIQASNKKLHSILLQLKQENVVIRSRLLLYDARLKSAVSTLSIQRHRKLTSFKSIYELRKNPCIERLQFRKILAIIVACWPDCVYQRRISNYRQTLQYNSVSKYVIFSKYQYLLKRIFTRLGYLIILQFFLFEIRICPNEPQPKTEKGGEYTHLISTIVLTLPTL